MESEDLINLPASSDSGNVSEEKDPSAADRELCTADSLPNTCKIQESQLNGECEVNDDVANKSIQSLLPESVKDLNENATIVQVSVELAEAVDVQETTNCFSSTVHTENGHVTVREESPPGNRKRDGSSISSQDKHASCILFLWLFLILKLCTNISFGETVIERLASKNF